MRVFPLLCCPRVVQIVSFALAALYSGLWWWRWFRSGAESKMWPQLGLFSGVMCVGSIVGTVAWASNMVSFALYFEYHATNVNSQEIQEKFASSKRWLAVFFLTYSVEFLCVIVPKLILLGSLVRNASSSSGLQVPEMSVVRRKWHGPILLTMYKVMAGVVVICSVSGMIAYVVASVYLVQTANLHDQVALAYEIHGNSTEASDLLEKEGLANSKADTAAAIQNIIEAFVLVLISVAYVVLVPLSVSIYRVAERVASCALMTSESRSHRNADDLMRESIVADTKQIAVEQRQRLVIACIVVLITFPVRATFDILRAYSRFNVYHDPHCDDCGSCQSEQHLIDVWLNYLPEIRPIVVAISSPLPLIVSLWLVTAVQSRANAISTKLQRVGRLTSDL